MVIKKIIHYVPFKSSPQHPWLLRIQINDISLFLLKSPPQLPEFQDLSSNKKSLYLQKNQYIYVTSKNLLHNRHNSDTASFPGTQNNSDIYVTLKNLLHNRHNFEKTSYFSDKSKKFHTLCFL